MRKMRGIKTAALLFSAAMFFKMWIPVTVYAGTPDFGWYEENGSRYWYENGVRQGGQGRGKEIYDPGSDGWYWLDAIDGGKMASGKDVYQESWAGQYADREDGTGKWVRYDENGRMVKGWDTTREGTYYFDVMTGAMAKGETIIENKNCAFDRVTGIGIDCRWYQINGIKYWYENGIRQGMEGRGKEIYDPESNAWYWLDSVDDGKMAVSKDVYQESNGGKWVRYDENGHMVKGWNERNGKKFYFDPVTGAMAKGIVEIDGVKYYFNEITGIFEGEYRDSTGIKWNLLKETMYNSERRTAFMSVYERDSRGNVTKNTQYRGNKKKLESEYIYEYNGAGNEIKCTFRTYNKSYKKWMGTIKITDYNADGLIGRETIYNLEGEKSSSLEYQYDGQRLVRKNRYTYGNGSDVLSNYEIYFYNERGSVSEVKYMSVSNGKEKMTTRAVYAYDEKGNQIRKDTFNSEGSLSVSEVTEYIEYENQSYISTCMYYGNDGRVSSGSSYEYKEGYMTKAIHYTEDRAMSGYTIYENTSFPGNVVDGQTHQSKMTDYDKNGNMLTYTVYEYKAYE